MDRRAALSARSRDRSCGITSVFSKWSLLRLREDWLPSQMMATLHLNIEAPALDRKKSDCFFLPGLWQLPDMQTESLYREPRFCDSSRDRTLASTFPSARKPKNCRLTSGAPLMVGSTWQQLPAQSFAMNRRYHSTVQFNQRTNFRKPQSASKWRTRSSARPYVASSTVDRTRSCLCRVTNGAPPRTGSRQLAVSSTDTAAVLGRLAVLGESMLLSGEQISTFNYVAASDSVRESRLTSWQSFFYLLLTYFDGH
jgi:hypothetical protein